MDTTDKIIELIINVFKELLWPLTILIIFCHLKKPIIKLIDRIKKAGSKGFGMEFYPEPQSIKMVNKALESTSSFKNDFKLILDKFHSESIEIVDEIINDETALNQLKDINDREQLMNNYARLLIFKINYDRIYQWIYGSQLELLFELDLNVKQTKLNLKKFYDRVFLEFPDFYKNYPYNQYLLFLENNKLIESIDEEQIKITNFGKDFLKYVFEMGLQTKKLY